MFSRFTKKIHGHPWPIRIAEKLGSVSYERLLMSWVLSVCLFALAYFAISSVSGQHGSLQLAAMQSIPVRFYNSVYFSIITATSTGFGDITPRGFSKLLASAQSILSLSIFAVFVSKLVSHRQEIALSQIHRHTFDVMYHNIREGLYIIRKDLSEVMDHLSRHQPMRVSDWQKIMIAFKTSQSLICDIPEFYDTENYLYTIDLRKEQLLQESVHRTLHRINELLNALGNQSIEWLNEERCISELQALCGCIGTITLLWQERSPYHQSEAFENIYLIHKTIEDRVSAAASPATAQS